MGWKARQKKRSIRAAQERHSATIKERFYLTFVKRDCACNMCGRSLRVLRSHECVYRHSPKTIYCVDCAQKENVHYRLSRAWEKNNRTGA